MRRENERIHWIRPLDDLNYAIFNIGHPLGHVSALARVFDSLRTTNSLFTVLLRILAWPGGVVGMQRRGSCTMPSIVQSPSTTSTIHYTHHLLHHPPPPPPHPCLEYSHFPLTTTVPPPSTQKYFTACMFDVERIKLKVNLFAVLGNVTSITITVLSLGVLKWRRRPCTASVGKWGVSLYVSRMQSPQAEMSEISYSVVSN